jgi:hypothetical protein
VLFESYHTVLPSDALLEKYRVSAPNVCTTLSLPLPNSSFAQDYFRISGDVGLHKRSLQLLSFSVILEAHTSYYFVSTWPRLIKKFCPWSVWFVCFATFRLISCHYQHAPIIP